MAPSSALTERRYSCAVVIRTPTHKFVIALKRTLSMRNVALVFFCAITFAQAQGPRSTPAPSIVYAVHDPDAIKDYQPNPRLVHAVLDCLVHPVRGLTVL